MDYKKVVVNSVDMRKFAEALVYLGSIGAEVTKNCLAVKGLMLRAEVELPWDVPVNETQNIRVSMKDVISRDDISKDAPKKEEAPKADKKPVAKRTTKAKGTQGADAENPTEDVLEPSEGIAEE